MLSMGNGKFAALVAAILATHVLATNILKITDRDVRSLVEAKYDIMPDASANALLLGGSGVHYGLSARQLSEATPYSFLNLALIVEGNGWENYLGFIDKLKIIEPEEIELVIYSSADFYKLEESDEFTLTGARKGMLLYDKRSWIQRIVRPKKGFGPWSVDRTVIDPKTGDKVFLEGVCDIYFPAAVTLPPGNVAGEIAARAQDLSVRFPNARVLIRPWPVSEHKGHDLDALHTALAEGLAAEGVEFMRPPRPIYHEDWACDAAFHPNATGRDALTDLEAKHIMEWLTEDAT